MGEDAVNSIICRVHIVYINPTANSAKGSTASERAKNEVVHHGHNSLDCQLYAIHHRGFSVTGLKKILNRRQSPLLTEEKACQKTPGSKDVAKISTRESFCNPSRELRAGDPRITSHHCTLQQAVLVGIAPLGDESTLCDTCEFALYCCKPKLLNITLFWLWFTLFMALLPPNLSLSQGINSGHTTKGNNGFNKKQKDRKDWFPPMKTGCSNGEKESSQTRKNTINKKAHWWLYQPIGTFIVDETSCVFLLSLVSSVFNSSSNLKVGT